MSLRIWFFATSLVALSWIISCSRNSEISGKSGVDETSNGLSAVVLDSTGNPLGDALVFVRPANFRSDGVLRASDPDSGYWTLVTDIAGRFQVSALPAGNYRMQIFNGRLGLLLSLHVDSTGLADTLIADTLLAKALSSVHGCVSLPPDVPYARVLLEGMETSTTTDSSGCYTLSGVPSGALTVLAISPHSGSILGSDTIVVQPDSSYEIGTLPVPASTDSQWAHEAKIVLDTRSTGIYLAKRLLAYPLKVFLYGDNFPTGASPNGADLRVVDSAGNAMPFTIAYWNALDRKAIIYVRLPRIEANDSVMVAKLRWGRPETLPASEPGKVFDSLDNVMAMFPLYKSSLDTQGKLRTPDLSAWANHGVVLSTGGTPPSFGPEGAWFDGQYQGVAIGNFPLDFGGGDFTVSAWLRPQQAGGIWLTRDKQADSVWNHGERAFYFGEPNTSVNVASGWHPAQASHGIDSGKTINRYVFAKDSVSPDQWVHLTVRRRFISSAADTAAIQFFVNGSMVATIDSLTLEENDTPSDSVYIAGRMFGRAYRGYISQLQIYRGLRGSEWIYLDSRIQLPDNPAIHIVPIR